MKQLVLNNLPSRAAALDCLSLVRAAYGAASSLAGGRPSGPGALLRPIIPAGLIRPPGRKEKTFITFL